jgi:DegV family protein with EDD domain
MNKVAVMTDTIASIPKEIAEEYGIEVIPFRVVMDGKDYLETEISMEQIYARLNQRENLPTTSFPSPEEFLRAYQELSQRAETILHISLTSAFSAAYRAAIEAKEMAREKLPETKIEVLDSRTVTAGELLIVLEAARAATQGKNLEEVIKTANNIIPQMNLLSIRDTLFYVDRLGRICEAKPWAEAELTSNFRALTEADSSTGGVTKPVARAKTKTQIMKRMVDIAKERIGDRRLHAAIVHANVRDEALELKRKVLSQFECTEFYIADASAMTAIHNGQGLIEFGFYGSD